jgi:hypothetical protein
LLDDLAGVIDVRQPKNPDRIPGAAILISRLLSVKRLR